MRPVFSIDITKDKNNTNMNSGEFLVAQPSEALAQERDKSTDAVIKLIMRSVFSPVRIVSLVCAGVGFLILFCIVGVITEEEGMSFAHVYSNAAWLFWVAGALLVAAVILGLIDRKKTKSMEQKENAELEQAGSKAGDIAKRIYAEMGVPHDAVTVDILSFSYKMKDGMPVVKKTDTSLPEYDVYEYDMYVEEDRLCLANLEGIYAFPLSGLRAIRTVDENICIWSWNKETDPDKGSYRAYGLRVDKENNVHLKPYHILELEHDGEIWGIWFPCYELPAFQRFTGLLAEG